MVTEAVAEVLIVIIIGSCGSCSDYSCDFGGGIVIVDEVKHL
jgi:hypothetical protein